MSPQGQQPVDDLIEARNDGALVEQPDAPVSLSSMVGDAAPAAYVPAAGSSAGKAKVEGIKPVAEIQGADDFERLYTAGMQPVLFTGAARSSMTIEEFGRRFADEEIGLSDNPLKRGDPTHYSTVGEYVEVDLKRDDCSYMCGWEFDGEYPDLFDEFELPEFQPSDFIRRLPGKFQFHRNWFFLGKEGTLSDLHVDAFTTGAFLYMLEGQKTVRLVSPLDRADVLQSDNLFLEATERDYAERGIQMYEAVISPGTVLYIPGSWLHYVRNDTNTLMLTGNFATGPAFVTFYPNFRSLVAQDIDACDTAYFEDLESLTDSLEGSAQDAPLTAEVASMLAAEAARLDDVATKRAALAQRLQLLASGAE